MATRMDQGKLIAMYRSYHGGKLTDAQIVEKLQDVKALESLMAEMVSDYAGNQFTDESFWKDVFGQIAQGKPEGLARRLIERLRMAVMKMVGLMNKVINQPGFRETWLTGEQNPAEWGKDVNAALKSAYAQWIDAINTTGYEGMQKAHAAQFSQFSPRRAQTETPEFKKWFGDWENASLRDFLNGKPLADLNTNEAPHQGYAALREWAVGIFKDYGFYANNPTLGKVLMDERSIRDSMAHGINPFKAVAFKAVPDVIERGRIVHTENRGNIDSFYISAPVRINNTDDVVTVLVHRDSATSRMYLHSVTTKENLRDGQVNPGLAPKNPSDPGLSRQGGIYTILHDALNFNGDSSKVVDAEGKPLVVYHGTKSDFAEFDHAKGERLPGFWFTPEMASANAYAANGVHNARGYPNGANVMPVYLSIKNPRIYEVGKESYQIAWDDYESGGYFYFVRFHINLMQRG